MTVGQLAAIEAVLLVGGAVGSFLLTSWVAKDGVRSSALMASVAVWSILFGILPFFVFALVSRVAGPVDGRPPQGWEALVLNSVVFALFLGPIMGFVHGMRHWRRLGEKK